MRATELLEAHVANCQQCSGPDDGCDEGQRLEEQVIRQKEKLKRTLLRAGWFYEDVRIGRHEVRVWS